jgi:hypothetical protein
MVPLAAIDPAIISRLEAPIAIQATPIIIQGVCIVCATSTDLSYFDEIIYPAGACPGLVLIPCLFSRPSVGPCAIICPAAAPPAVVCAGIGLIASSTALASAAIISATSPAPATVVAGASAPVMATRVATSAVIIASVTPSIVIAASCYCRR